MVCRQQQQKQRYAPCGICTSRHRSTQPGWLHTAPCAGPTRALPAQSLEKTLRSTMPTNSRTGATQRNISHRKQSIAP